MSKYTRGPDRDELLANVAEMYYVDNQTQAQIARTIGVTRSAISRMLTESRQKGIVAISVRHPMKFDPQLERQLRRRFGLLDAHVLHLNQALSYDALRGRVGQAAAHILSGLLRPHVVCGVSWGTFVSATIDALTVAQPIPMEIVQLVGVLGSSSNAFNAQALVEMMARKVGGSGTYLYSPFIVENAQMARSIRNIPNVRQTIAKGERSDIALLGIGTILDENYSSLYQGGYISRKTLHELRAVGAVGDVSGHHFDSNGCTPDTTFHDRLVGVAGDQLLAIPVRLGVSASLPKAPAILGALRGGYVNQLVTDSRTAEAVLALDSGAALGADGSELLEQGHDS